VFLAHDTNTASRPFQLALSSRSHKILGLLSKGDKILVDVLILDLFEGMSHISNTKKLDLSNLYVDMIPFINPENPTNPVFKERHHE